MISPLQSATANDYGQAKVSLTTQKILIFLFPIIYMQPKFLTIIYRVTFRSPFFLDATHEIHPAFPSHKFHMSATRRHLWNQGLKESKL
jgi:hypothetical protein